MADEECVLGTENRRRIITLEGSDKEQWSAINTLTHRLPTWAWLIIVCLSSIVASLITVITRKG